MTIPGSERHVRDGEAYISGGLTEEMARKCLDAAVAAGFPESVVRTGDDGFYVPEAVVPILYPPEKPQRKTTRTAKPEQQEASP